MCTARKCYKGILCSIYWIVSIKKSFSFFITIYLVSFLFTVRFFFIISHSNAQYFCEVEWKTFSSSSSSLFFSLSCLNCFSSGLFIQSLSGRMHLRGRWCAPFKRNANGKTTLRRAGGGWPDAQVLGSYVGYALLELSPFLSLSSFFYFYLLLLNLNLFFSMARKKREEKKMPKNTG